MRTTFVEAALADFAGYAVLGLFTAVAPAFLGEELGVTSPAVVGLVVFAVFARPDGWAVMLELVPQGVAMPAECLALIAVARARLGVLVPGLARAQCVIAGFGHGVAFRAGLAAVNAGAPGGPAQRGGVEAAARCERSLLLLVRCERLSRRGATGAWPGEATLAVEGSEPRSFRVGTGVRS